MRLISKKTKKIPSPPIRRKKKDVPPKKRSLLFWFLFISSLACHTALLIYPFIDENFFQHPPSTPPSSFTFKNSHLSKPAKIQTSPQVQRPTFVPLREEIPLTKVEKPDPPVIPLAYKPPLHPQKRKIRPKKMDLSPPARAFSHRPKRRKQKIHKPKLLAKRTPKKVPKRIPKKNPQKNIAAKKPSKVAPNTKATSNNPGPSDGPPSVVYRVKHYPRRCRRRGHEGRVELEVCISAQGQCKRVQIISSSGCSRLVRAARESAYQSKFLPAIRNGKKVGGWKKLVYIYRLR